jgi:hypothetical protein
MPLSVNVGLSRKASKDYQSTGVSINIVAELDQALLTRPEELQRRIDGLYREAEDALDRHTGVPAPGACRQPPPAPGRMSSAAPSPGNGNGEGNGNGNSHGRVPAAMTASQRRAILAIAKRLNVDVDAECRDIVGAELDDLGIRQASQLIDHLKSLQSASGGRNMR